ncbi:hypothetical protein YYE_04424 [Plasmodium vinckei vinckei]|uniref:PIR protein CIR protein n=1 Tax=Plasmodium vinckei vinckei TaxID=54757 RepID=A0A081IA87_PLAVN|nr:hypothetical protein YYE_04424 [Plasmodium vinckei vinckei]
MLILFNQYFYLIKCLICMSQLLILNYNFPQTNSNNILYMKDLIDNKNLMVIDIKDMSKFYDIFNILCTMYTNIDMKYPNFGAHCKHSKEFVKNIQNI